MERYVPFEKLSKKKQREQNAAKRGSWLGVNPVTRKAENPRAYNRRKAQKWSDCSNSVPFDFYIMLKKSRSTALTFSGLSSFVL